MDGTRPQLVAIVGGSGAGKSRLAERLTQLLGPGESVWLCLDDFYRDRSHLPMARRRRVNFDHPRAIDWPLLEQVLGCLAGRSPVELPRYDFSIHARIRTRQFVPPRPVVIVEGLWLYRRPALRRLFDFRVFIECPAAARFERRLSRDVTERGRDRASVMRQFFTRVLPMHDRFVAGQIRWANVVLHSPAPDNTIERLAEQIRSAARSTH